MAFCEVATAYARTAYIAVLKFSTVAADNIGYYYATSSVHLKPYFAKFDSANWIAISAALISIFSVYQNNKSASKRDRLKSKREEFNKQIGSPIEKALDEFLALSDKLRDLAELQPANQTKDADALLADASRAQRKLSRAVKKASSSELCVQKDWSDVGSNSYDYLIESIENYRSASQYDEAQYLVSASSSIDTIVNLVNRKTYNEIKKYI